METLKVSILIQVTDEIGVAIQKSDAATIRSALRQSGFGMQDLGQLAKLLTYWAQMENIDAAVVVQTWLAGNLPETARKQAMFGKRQQ